MGVTWNSHCPSCGGEVVILSRTPGDPLPQDDMEWYACRGCRRQPQSMRKDLGTDISVYAWEGHEPMKPDTPNDPDGIDLEYISDAQGCRVQFIDPATDEGVVMAFPPETPREHALKHARFYLYRHHGERVIKPEHRRGEYDT